MATVDIPGCLRARSRRNLRPTLRAFIRTVRWFVLTRFAPASPATTAVPTPPVPVPSATPTPLVERQVGLDVRLWNGAAELRVNMPSFVPAWSFRFEHCKYPQWVAVAD